MFSGAFYLNSIKGKVKLWSFVIKPLHWSLNTLDQCERYCF